MITDDIMEKFNIALNLNKEDAEVVIEKFMMQYISCSFNKASQKYKVNPTKTCATSDVMNPNLGQAINKIPKWALKPDQCNHRIIRAFFQVEAERRNVCIKELEARCSDEENHPDTFVRDFRGNFNQLKIDAPKSYGKVFEIESGVAVIWDYVKDTLLAHKDYFIK